MSEQIATNKAVDTFLDNWCDYMGEELEEVTSAKKAAIATFKRTKDPIKRREWARRVVIADQTVKTLKSANKRAKATMDRLSMIKGDLELQLIEAEVRAQEAEAYAKTGKQLHLVGEKLIEARTRANTLKMQYTNLEVSMEGAEKLIDERSPEKIVAEAERLINL